MRGYYWDLVFSQGAPSGLLSFEKKKLKTFHPGTRSSHTEPEATVWKPNWTLCDSPLKGYSQCSLSYPCPRKDQMTSLWLWTSLSKQVTRAPFCPFIFPLAFINKRAWRVSLSLQRCGCITSDSCQQRLCREQRRSRQLCSNHFSHSVCWLCQHNTLKWYIYIYFICEIENFQDAIIFLSFTLVIFTTDCVRHPVTEKPKESRLSKLKQLNHMATQTSGCN